MPGVTESLDTSNFESLHDAEDEDFLKGKAPLLAKDILYSWIFESNVVLIMFRSLGNPTFQHLANPILTFFGQ